MTADDKPEIPVGPGSSPHSVMGCAAPEIVGDRSPCAGAGANKTYLMIEVNTSMGVSEWLEIWG